MGNTISVTNESNVPINIAIKQIGIVDWENELKPGKTYIFKVGRVWFTVEAIVDDESIYDDRARYSEVERTLPIVLTTVGALGAVVAGGVAFMVASAGTAATAVAATGATVVSAETATATGAGATVAGGAVVRTVIKNVGKTVLTQSAIAGASIGLTSIIAKLEDIRTRKPLVKASLHGVFAGDNPKLIVKGNSEGLRLEYANGETEIKIPEIEVMGETVNFVTEEKENIWKVD